MISQQIKLQLSMHKKHYVEKHQKSTYEAQTFESRYLSWKHPQYSWIIDINLKSTTKKKNPPTTMFKIQI